MYKTSGQVLLSAGVSLIPNEKCILCDFAWPPFHDGCLWAKAGVYKYPLTEEAAASRRHFHYRCNNWHLGATGCSALTDRLGAGSLSGCMTLTSLPNCRTPGHLPPSSAHGLSKQRGNRENNEGKPYRSALQKARPVFRADTLSILRGLAYSALNSQMSSAPRFTQK